MNVILHKPKIVFFILMKRKDSFERIYNPLPRKHDMLQKYIHMLT